jgi:hypothetical protein
LRPQRANIKHYSLAHHIFQGADAAVDDAGHRSKGQAKQAAAEAVHKAKQVAAAKNAAAAEEGAGGSEAQKEAAKEGMEAATAEEEEQQQQQQQQVAPEGVSPKLAAAAAAKAEQAKAAAGGAAAEALRVLARRDAAAASTAEGQDGGRGTRQQYHYGVLPCSPWSKKFLAQYGVLERHKKAQAAEVWGRRSLMQQKAAFQNKRGKEAKRARQRISQAAAMQVGRLVGRFGRQVWEAGLGGR